MWDPKIRESARRLRRAGKALDEISMRLDVSRSTVFVWVKDIPSSIDPKLTWLAGAQKLGSQRMKEKHARLRKEVYETTDLRRLRDSIIRDFVVMYLGEGYRRNRNVVHICNTNPTIMLLAVKALRKLDVDLGAKNVRFKLLLYPDHKDRALKGFWAKRLEISSKQINVWRPAKKQRSSEYRRSVHGLLYLSINDTYLRARMQAFMDAVETDWKTK
jgi:hypothetical protein